MWKVINVSADRSKLDLQRKATKFDPEPAIGGIRLRQGHLMLLEDEQFDRLKPTLEAWQKNGMVDFGPAKGDEAPRAGVSVVAKPEFAINPDATPAPAPAKKAPEAPPPVAAAAPPPPPPEPDTVPGPEEWGESPTDPDKPKKAKKKLFENK